MILHFQLCHHLLPHHGTEPGAPLYCHIVRIPTIPVIICRQVRWSLDLWFTSCLLTDWILLVLSALDSGRKASMYWESLTGEREDNSWITIPPSMLRYSRRDWLMSETVIEMWLPPIRWQCAIHTVRSSAIIPQYVESTGWFLILLEWWLLRLE